jgi:hypothetical protein
MFEFAVMPAPELSGVEVSLANGADAASMEWYAYLCRGIQRGLETAREHGREFTRMTVEVQKIHTHPTDTTVQGCERYGCSFVLDELWHRAVPLPQ